MKKIVYILLIIVCSSCVRRTPENLLKIQFGIDLSSSEYTVDSFDDEWDSTGDGECRIVYSFTRISQNVVDELIEKGALPFPIPDTIPKGFRLENRFVSGEHKGYYLYVEDEGNPYSFSYFVLDLDDKQAVLHYRYL